MIAPMDYRKITIRVFLCSLGIAAFSGILAVLLPGGTGITGRLLGTAILTALCSAVLLFAVQRSEVPNTRKFGVLLGIVTLAVYFFAAISIWARYFNSTLIGGNTLEERCGLTALLIAGCGILVSIGFLGAPYKKLQPAGIALSVVWLICMMIWLGVIWSGGSNTIETNAEHFVYPLQVLFPILVLCSIRRNTWYMGFAIGIALTCIGASQIALFTANGSLSDNNALFVFILITGSTASLLAILNVIQFRATKHAIHWAEYATFILACGAVGIFATTVYYSANNILLPELLLRLGVGIGILSSTAILGLLVSQVLRTSVFTTYSGSGLKAVCPRCDSDLFVPSGKSKCSECGLQIKLQIESPNCRTCGYDITKKQSSANCPECGVPIKGTSALQ